VRLALNWRLDQELNPLPSFRLNLVLNPYLSRLVSAELSLNLSKQLMFQLIRQLCPKLSPNLSLILSPWLSLKVSLGSMYEVTLVVSGQLNPHAPRQTRGQCRGMPRAGGMGRLVGRVS
jgi:hypothetical protein